MKNGKSPPEKFLRSTTRAGHLGAYGSMPPCLRGCSGFCISHHQKDHSQHRTCRRQHRCLPRTRRIRMINVSTNDHPFSPFVKSVPMQSMLRIVVGRASLTMPELGRTDIHSERPIGSDFDRLCVTFLARCAASHLEKRLDSAKIDLKSFLHSECLYALALVQEAVVTGAAAARQKAVFGRATVASPAMISEAAGRIHAQTIPYEVPYCRCS